MLYCSPLRSADSRSTASHLSGVSAAYLANPFTGVSTSYSWWLVCFQLIGLLAAAATVAKPALGKNVAPLIIILTTSIFLATDSVYNAPFGAYALSHNSNGKAASVIGTHANKKTNFVILTFAACIILNVANVLLAVTVADAPADVPTSVSPEVPANEPVPEIKVVEMAGEPVQSA